MKPNLFQQRKGYYINNDKIIFSFAEDLYKKQLSNIKVTKVSVQGSFTKWKNCWPLKKINSSLWALTKEIDEIKVPGNSGQPEFRFIINGEYHLNAVASLSLKYKLYDSHRGGYKNIVLLPQDSPNKIKEINTKIDSYKTDYQSKQELANFRAVPAANSLYRSYHPFIESKPNHPLEKKRLKTVQELIKKNNINSVINLADKQSKIPKIRIKYKKLIDNQPNILFTNRNHNYDIYYYAAQSQEFKKLLEKIILFILKNQAPFLIHCRIGTDRTGVISAILAALLGSRWSTIADDYKKSNKTGIKEYRDERLLEYTFTQLLNRSSIPENLEEPVISYFKINLDLTDRQIKTLKQKLS